MSNKFIPAFLWIKNYRSIKNQGFHFINEYTYTYDPETFLLTRTKNDQYINDFYGSDINISAIVGENGAGKTSLLNAIMDIFNFNGVRGRKTILVWSNGNVWVNYDYWIYIFEFSNDRNDLTLEINDNTPFFLLIYLLLSVYIILKYWIGIDIFMIVRI